MNNKIHWPAGAALLVVAAEAAQAEVVFDGSLGPVATLSGAFEIPNSYGTQVGANLFHSFARFNVNPGESATFTSNFGGLTAHVIGRVTGGAPSIIDGGLSSSIAGASLWLVNPDGLIFGPGAVLDVDGGFYASTADFLAFEDGGLFAATDPGASMLTVATPAAFGFRDANVAPIEAGAATLGVREGERLSLVGGDLVLTGTTLLAPSGVIDLGSVAGAGTMRPTLEVGSVADFGAVTLRGANVDTTAASGGEIHIRGGRLVLEMSTFLTANTVGADTTARGGDIRLDVNEAAILGGSQLSSTTFGAGNGGLIRLNAVGDVNIEGSVGGTPAGIFANVR
ncbi:MAG TPA: filamentous hemagglutinin N-terminal domain-containing protein, partial [Gammaproteobacteria bacterium]|nr:filamentous hemagglutinin N-terminal domain-containing protein [Gammaproteobacteria bacterium]